MQWMGARCSCHHVPIACMHMAMTKLSNSCDILRRRSAQPHAAGASGALKQHMCEALLAGQQAVPWRFAAAASKASASKSRPAAGSSKPTDGFQPDFTELVGRTVGMTNCTEVLQPPCKSCFASLTMVQAGLFQLHCR